MVVRRGNLVTESGAISPKALPKKESAPITFKSARKIETKDGKHPPALTKTIVETDKNGMSTSRAWRTAPRANCRRGHGSAENVCKNRLSAGHHQRRSRIRRTETVHRQRHVDGSSTAEPRATRRRSSSTSTQRAGSAAFVTKVKVIENHNGSWVPRRSRRSRRSPAARVVKEFSMTNKKTSATREEAVLLRQMPDRQPDGESDVTFANGTELKGASSTLHAEGLTKHSPFSGRKGGERAATGRPFFTLRPWQGAIHRSSSPRCWL